MQLLFQLHYRFGHFFSGTELLPLFTIPRFITKWPLSKGRQQELHQMGVGKLIPRCCGLTAMATLDIDAKKPPKYNFFSFSMALRGAPALSPSNNKAPCCIEDPDASISASISNNLVHKVFVCHNVALPSSVHIEQVFITTNFTR